MHRAFASAIGLPSRSTSASLMLAFLIPADVRRNRMLPPGAMVVGVLPTQTRQTPTNHRRRAGKRRQGRLTARGSPAIVHRMTKHVLVVIAAAIVLPSAV